MKVKVLSALIVILISLFSYKIYQRNILNRKGDTGDAPLCYGKPIHYKPEKGPYFGQNRGDDDLKSIADTSTFDYANMDDSTGLDDEDAFTNNFTVLPANSRSSIFLPDIEAKQKSYTLNIPVNDAEEGDPVNGWIDFNGNGKFDDNERAGSLCHKGKNIVVLTWLLYAQLQPSLTYARIRTCSKTFAEQIESPTTNTSTGEVEDYLVRIIKTEAPLKELKNYVNMDALKGNSSYSNVLTALSKLTIGSNKIKIKFSGIQPEIIGINNLHEASIYGLRVGHDTVQVLQKNPMIIMLAFDTVQENVSFKLLDIDGGDRIKIEGFYEGKIVHFKMRNLTDNFYYQFDETKNEIYGMPASDAGNDINIPSSLDMSAEVLFEGLTDSIRLSYSDDVETSAGTFTIADIAARKYRLPAINFSNFIADEKDNDIALSWKISNTSSIVSYNILRSLDGEFYETISKGAILSKDNNNYSFLDKNLPPNILNCYYSVVAVEKDNHTVMSNIVRLKRKRAASLSGFNFINRNFLTSIDLVFLIDMPGESVLNMYNYDGKPVRNIILHNVKKDYVFSLKDLGNLREGSYYVEIVNNQKKYLVQALKFLEDFPAK